MKKFDKSHLQLQFPQNNPYINQFTLQPLRNTST